MFGVLFYVFYHIFNWLETGGFDRWVDQYIDYARAHRERIHDPILLWIIGDEDDG